MENLYRNWKGGSKVFFTFCKRSWKIEIEWFGGICTFGKGWYEFAKELELAKGDVLVMYNDSVCGDQNLKICVFKANDFIGEKSLKIA